MTFKKLAFLFILVFSLIFVKTSFADGSGQVKNAVQTENTGQADVDEQIEESEITTVYFETQDLHDENEVMARYAQQFDDMDIRLVVFDEDQKYIPFLRNFNFNSLELVIDLKDDYLKFYKEMMFPDCLKSVDIFYKGSLSLTASDALDNFVLSLSVYCPDVILNGKPLKEITDWIKSVDHLGLLNQYSTNAKLNYLLDLVNAGALSVVNETPVFGRKLTVKIFDESWGVNSTEALFFGENFCGIPDSRLVADFDEAETAILIYKPVGITGAWAKGDSSNMETSSMYEVAVIDLHTMNMYVPFKLPVESSAEDRDVMDAVGKMISDSAKTDQEEKVDFDVKGIVSIEKEKINKNMDDADLKEALLPWYEEITEIETTSVSVQTSSEKVITETSAINVTRKATITQETATAQETAAAQETATAQEAAAAQETATAQEAAAAQETATAQEISAIQDATVTQPSTKAGVTTTVASLPEDDYYWLDDALLEKIFTALGDDVYRNTYQTIKKGNNLASGSKGSAALGLQKTLKAFGQEVTEDSSIGSTTLHALKDVQTSLGLEYTGKVSSRQYSLLMPALLIRTNEEAAEKILGMLRNLKEGNLYDYLKAGILCAEGAGYSAMKAFEKCGYGNYMEQCHNCIKELPYTGQLYLNTSLSGDKVTLKIETVSYDKPIAACIKINDSDNNMAACMMVRSIGSVSVDLPVGDYTIIEGFGQEWYGMKEMFGPDGTYKMLEFSESSDNLRLEKGHSYTITIGPETISDSGNILNSQTLEW